LPNVRPRRHSPVPSGQSVRICEGRLHLGTLVLAAVASSASGADGFKSVPDPLPREDVNGRTRMPARRSRTISEG
jgi:hypothetical protein